MTKKKTEQNQDSRFRKIIADYWKPETIGDIAEGEVYELGEKFINGDRIPYIKLITPEGQDLEILLGGACLRNIFTNKSLKEGAYIGIRFDGHDPRFKKAGNEMKTFSYYVYPYGQWKYLPEGGIEHIPAQPAHELSPSEIYENKRVTHNEVIEDNGINPETGFPF